MPSSSSTVNRSGCSACAERSRPHTARWDSSPGCCSPPRVTAPRVRTASRVPASRSSATRSLTVSRTECRAVRTAALSAAAPVPAAPSPEGGGQGSRSSAGASAPASSASVRAAVSDRAPPRPSSCSCSYAPSSVQRCVAGAGGSSAGSSHTGSSRPSPGPAAESRAPAGSGRRTSEPIEATGRPEASATSMPTAFAPAGASRIRSTRPVSPWVRTRDQAYGRKVRPSSPPPSAPSTPSIRPPSTIGCSAASSSAGCRP